MNYRDYIEIMRDEQLEESEAVKFYLNKASYWHKSSLSLKQYEEETQKALLKQFQEIKIKNIIMAIDIARIEKNLGYKMIEQYDEALERIAEIAIKERDN